MYWDICRKAEIGCHEKKKILAEKVVETFGPFRQRREELSDEAVIGFAATGSERAREAARATVAEAREAMGLLPAQ